MNETILKEQIKKYLNEDPKTLNQLLNKINGYLEKEGINIDFLYKTIILFFLKIIEEKDFFLEKMVNYFFELMKGSSIIELNENDLQIFSKYKDFFYIIEKDYKINIKDPIEQPFIIIKLDNHNLLYSNRFFYEEFILKDILDKKFNNNLRKNDIKINICEFIPEDKRNNDFIENIKKSLQYSLVFITGGPGSGKTYLTSFIYKCFKENYKNINKREPIIKICASTGKAAKVLKDKIKENIGEDIDVFTIHRLLEYNPKTNDFNYNKDNKIDSDLLIIDEASMVDIFIFRKLFEAINDNTNIIIVGDKDQLPSVNSGSLFSDLIGLDIDFKIELKTQYRSKVNPYINEIFNSIKKGEFCFEKICFYNNFDNFDNILNNNENNIYYFDISLQEQNNVNIFLEKWFGKYYKNIKKSIILTPFNEDYYIGVDRINEYIKKLIKNYYSEDIEIPIIITENDYENELFNGDIGYKKKDNKIYFNDDKKIFLNLIKSYKYAFAITIHKSQGSEYDDVFLLIPDEYSRILTKELIYTAITRAKNRVFILGKKDIFEKSLKNSLERKSGLKYIFEKKFNKNFF